jgi:hypothetical protein
MSRIHHRFSRCTDIPCAMVLTSYFVLSPVSMTLLVTVACGSRRVAPVGADIASPHDLTPAQGCQDHTTSLSATRADR